jgi:hypothetical protein
MAFRCHYRSTKVRVASSFLVFNGDFRNLAHLRGRCAVKHGIGRELLSQFMHQRLRSCNVTDTRQSERCYHLDVLSGARARATTAPWRANCALPNSDSRRAAFTSHPAAVSFWPLLCGIRRPDGRTPEPFQGGQSRPRVRTDSRAQSPLCPAFARAPCRRWLCWASALTRHGFTLSRQHHLECSGLIAHHPDGGENLPQRNERPIHPVLPSNRRHRTFTLGAFGKETCRALERLAANN